MNKLLSIFIILFLTMFSNCYGSINQGTGVFNSNGAVYVQEDARTNFIVDLYLTRQLEVLEITSNSTIGDVTINVSQATTTNTNDIICIKEGTRFYQGQVVATASGEIKVDSPLDYAYTTAATIYRAEHDLSFDGSGSSLIYKISPPSDALWHIVRLMVYIEDDSTMDDGTFGGASALTNGLLFRLKNTIYQNIFNVKTNGELAQRAYDRTYVSKPPSGTGNSVITRRTFGGESKNGVIIELDGATSDELQAIVQDDLTDQVHVHIIAQGYVYTK